MAALPFDTLLHRIGELQPRLPAGESLLLAGAALGAVAVPAAWKLASHVSVIAHVGAHAATGSGPRRKAAGTRLRPGSTGVTRVPRGIAVSALISGGPSLLGLVMAKIISVGYIVAVLWLALIALVITLPVLRGRFSFFAGIMAGILVYAVARYAAVPVQSAMAYIIAWILLLAGVLVVVEHGWQERDAQDVTEISEEPRSWWSALWLAAAGAAVVAGGALLL